MSMGDIYWALLSDRDFLWWPFRSKSDGKLLVLRSFALPQEMELRKTPFDKVKEKILAHLRQFPDELQIVTHIDSSPRDVADSWFNLGPGLADLRLIDVILNGTITPVFRCTEDFFDKRDDFKFRVNESKELTGKIHGSNGPLLWSF